MPVDGASGQGAFIGNRLDRGPADTRAIGHVGQTEHDQLAAGIAVVCFPDSLEE